MKKYFCYLKGDAGRLIHREIKIGQSGQVFTEVKSGLKENDLVYLGITQNYDQR